MRKKPEETPLKVGSVEEKKRLAVRKGLLPALAIIIVLSFIMSFSAKAVNMSPFSFTGIFTGEALVKLLSLTAVFTVLLGVFAVYLTYTQPDFMLQKRHFGVVLLSVIFTFAVSLLLGKAISIYAMPLALGSLFVAVLVDKEKGIVANIFTSVAFFILFFIIFGTEMLLAATISLVTNIVSGTVIIIRIAKSYTRGKFLASGVLVALIMAPVALVTSFIMPGFTWVKALYVVIWTMLSSLLSVIIFVAVLPVFEVIFKLPTNFNLEEICSIDRPLLKRLSEEAPGTFNHSLAVGTLAQLCAIAIGENPSLAKAGAYYHDVGKLKDPLCYVENQKGYNPHDDFIPEVSVYMITQHTNWGYETLKAEKNIPHEVAIIAKEHHGTTPINYFYYKVKNITENNLESKEFSYDGPIPGSKVSAIVMIADTVEAAIRSMGAQDEKTLRENIHRLIEEKRNMGQFDNSDLTLKDLKVIENTLVEGYKGLHHQRIAYVKK